MVRLVTWCIVVNHTDDCLVGTVVNFVYIQSSLRSVLDLAGLGFALFLTLVGALLVKETDLVRGNVRIMFAFSVLTLLFR